MEEEKKRIDDLKTKDSESYLANLYERRRVILERMSDRSRQREEFSKRGSKGA